MTYEEMLQYVRNNGTWKNQHNKLKNGTKPRCLSMFAPGQIQYDLQKGFPLITTKFVSLKMVAAELLWFLQGRTDLEYLHKHGCHIWDSWSEFLAVEVNGQFGGNVVDECYGAKWRKWRGEWNDFRDQGCVYHDQIKTLIQDIGNAKHDYECPEARRLVVSAWDVANMPPTAPPACHTMFQCNVTDGKLSLQMYQRSCDLFLGCPFNIASYALLTHILARITGLEVGTLTITLGDAHIYENHIEQVDEQLTRNPLQLPELLINPALKTLSDFENADPANDFYPFGYVCHPALKGEVAVG